MSGRPAARCSSARCRSLAVGVSPDRRMRPAWPLMGVAARAKLEFRSTSAKSSRTKGRITLRLYQRFAALLGAPLCLCGRFCVLTLNLTKSRALQQRAERVIPGGVDSPARAFKSVGGDPPIIVRGSGSRMWDADGNEYIDYVGSWGPLILGHAHPEVVAAIERATRDGVSFGASTPSEAELAELVVEAMPSVEMVRFVSSGTEATM